MDEQEQVELILPNAPEFERVSQEISAISSAPIPAVDAYLAHLRTCATCATYEWCAEGLRLLEAAIQPEGEAV